MNRPMYPSIEELNYAVLSNLIAYKCLRLSFEGGEVCIKHTDGRIVYRGSEQSTITELFELFFDIQPVGINR